MSIRVRLVILCLVVSLLPAIPLSLLVQTLLEKSFDVGLNTTVEDALKGGTTISRLHLSRLHKDFERDVIDLVDRIEEPPAAGAAMYMSSTGDTIHFLSVTYQPGGESKGMARWVTETPEFLDIVEGANIVERGGGPDRDDIEFFDTEDRAIQISIWDLATGGDARAAAIFFERTDPAFLSDANRLIDGRQIFAELKLTRPILRRSFFYPFIIIYGVILVVALLVALLMAERMANPIRRLAAGADAVAAGDWTFRLAERSGGEVGRLVDAFNSMVSRLDGQQRRLIDMERMATWREMARHLAHEIKNPLLPIRLTVEEMKDQYDGADPRYAKLVTESVHVIGEELDHLQRLVKEFSSFARMPDIAPRMSSFDSLARDVVGLYPQPTVELMSAPGIAQFSFDPDQLRRVLVNLLDNAVAAVATVGEPAIRVALESSEDNFILTVSDNGPGVDEAILARIFDPYFTTKEEGSGLGLAMVKNIILLHGGAIDVDSSAGQGTTFRIELPMTGPLPA